MTLQDILRVKGSDVHTTTPDATLELVVDLLVRNNVGSLVVCEAKGTQQRGCLLGIITERDILRTLATSKKPLSQQFVGEVMTRNMVTGSASDSVEDIMGVMTRHRIRHLPVVENEQLLGIISIGDVVKSQHDELSLENHYLKNYIQS